MVFDPISMDEMCTSRGGSKAALECDGGAYLDSMVIDVNKT